MKPVIVYVDDEPNNLTIFESTLPEDWEIHVFDNPLSALEQLEELRPWVVATDQRMPGMVGVKFLEIARKINPDSKRILITGFSDEDLVVESVRTAQVSDYIRKPWDADDLEIRLQKIVESFLLEKEVREQQIKLTEQNAELTARATALESAKQIEAKMREELQAWAPPFVLQTLGKVDAFPMRADLALITFDIIGSSKLHGQAVNNLPARTHILRSFSEIITRHGGWRESHAGDSAYGHFGLTQQLQKPADAAFAAATEFRVFLRNFAQKYSIEVECGVGLHFAKDCLVEVHEVQTIIDGKVITQKSADSTSTDVDLVHRMESFVHHFPGSNIIMSKAFLDKLTTTPQDLVDLGEHTFKGQPEASQLYMKKSDKVTQSILDEVLDSEESRPNLKLVS